MFIISFIKNKTMSKKKLIRKIGKLVNKFPAWTKGCGNSVSIQDIDDEHLINLQVWLYTRIKPLKKLNLPDKPINNTKFNKAKWFEVLRLEYYRRQLIRDVENENYQQLILEIEELFGKL